MSGKDKDKPFATNRKAKRNYHIVDNFEAGIQLLGTEVKSIRDSLVSLDESFATIEKGEVWIHKMRIEPWTHGNVNNHDPIRLRKVLLKKVEINRIIGQINAKGYTMVPLKLYPKRGFIKIELGLGKGKDDQDKREAIKKRDADRETRRAISEARKRG